MARRMSERQRARQQRAERSTTAAASQHAAAESSTAVLADSSPPAAVAAAEEEELDQAREELFERERTAQMAEQRRAQAKAKLAAARAMALQARMRADDVVRMKDLATVAMQHSIRHDPKQAAARQATLDRVLQVQTSPARLPPALLDDLFVATRRLRSKPSGTFTALIYRDRSYDDDDALPLSSGDESSESPRRKPGHSRKRVSFSPSVSVSYSDTFGSLQLADEMTGEEMIAERESGEQPQPQPLSEAESSAEPSPLHAAVVDANSLPTHTSIARPASPAPAAASSPGTDDAVSHSSGESAPLPLLSPSRRMSNIAEEETGDEHE